MPQLDQVTRAAIRDEALRRGADPSAAVAHAESLMPGMSLPATAEPTTGTPTTGRPIFDRLLLGALPFVRVREFRALWLGLDERIPDDDLMCGEFAAKHGGASASPGTATPSPDPAVAA